MYTLFYKWLSETRGVTAIEYSLLAGLIGLAAIATSMALGDNYMNMFSALSGHIEPASLSTLHSHVEPSFGAGAVQ